MNFGEQPEQEKVRALMDRFVRDKASERFELDRQIDATLRVLIEQASKPPICLSVVIRPDRPIDVSLVDATDEQPFERQSKSCAVKLSYALFEALLAGDKSPHVAFLEGSLSASGDQHALVRFGVLFA